MKKLVFILMMFVSIFSFAEMKDGTYSAEKNYDSEWKSIVKIYKQPIIYSRHREIVYKLNCVCW